MRKDRFTDEHVVGILKGVEAGVTAKVACRKHGISVQTLYRWNAKYGRMEANEARRLRDLEDEDRRLKQMVADLSPDNQALKEVLKKETYGVFRTFPSELATRARAYAPAA